MKTKSPEAGAAFGDFACIPLYLFKEASEEFPRNRNFLCRKVEKYLHVTSREHIFVIPTK